MNINNKSLSVFIENLNNETLTTENIDKFGSDIDVDGLLEFFNLIEKEEIDIFALKVYTTVYDKNKIKELECLKSKKYIDAMFAVMWEQEAIESDTLNLSGALLGFVIFGSDLISRIRNGYEILNYEKEKLNEQIKNFILDMNIYIEDNNFFKILTQNNIDIEDDEILNSTLSDFDTMKTIRKRVRFAASIILNRESVLDLYKNEFQDISIEDMSFMDEHHLMFLLDAEKENDFDKKENPFILSNKDSLIEEALTADFNTNINSEENQNIFEMSSLKKMFSFFEKFKYNSEKPKRININNLRSNKNKKGSSLKVAIGLFLLILIFGFSIVALIKTKDISGDTNTTLTVAKENIKNSNFDIKRSGSNVSKKEN